MTDIMGTRTSLPIVRIAVLADGRISDMALPSELPVREILPAVRRLLPAEATDDDLTTDTAGPHRVTLGPVGGPPFSPDASLDTVGVADGDLLVLQSVPLGPPAQGIVEDVADAAVIFSPSRQRPWGITRIRGFAHAVWIVFLLLATGFACAHRLVTGSVASLFALSALAAAAVVGALVLRSRSVAVAVSTSVAALIPVAAAFALAVPGEFGPAQIMLGAAGATAWSVISIILSQRGYAIFTATTVVGAAVLAAAAVAEIWQPPLMSLGCGLVVVAVWVSVQAPQFSALLARLPLPVIPAPGDPLPSAPSAHVLADLPQRVRISEAHQTGFIAGAVVLSVLGALAIAGRGAPGGWGWYAVAAVCVAALLRARVWDSAACKTWLLAQPFLVSGGLLVICTAQGRYLTAAVSLGVFALLTLGFGIVATNPSLAEPESYSLPMRRLLGFLAAAVDASLIPVLAYLVGLFAWVLDR